MKEHAKLILLTSLFGAILTGLYFLALTRLFQSIAVERYYFATWGFGVYLLLLSVAGFMFSLKKTHNTSLVCSIGIPAIFVVIIFVSIIVAPDLIRIPIFNQFREYNESIRYGALGIIVFPSCCAAVFVLAYLACSLKRKYYNSKTRRRS